jgi:hypothetical protein
MREWPLCPGPKAIFTYLCVSKIKLKMSCETLAGSTGHATETWKLCENKRHIIADEPSEWMSVHKP